MTWRRLFLILFTGSMVLMLAVWGLSLRYSFTVQATTPPSMTEGSLRLGRISIQIIHPVTTPFGGWEFDGGVAPSFLGREMRNYWQVSTEEVRPGSHPATAHTIHFTRVMVPVWFPWLIFVAGAFTFCRIMERRALGKMERDHAEKVAAGSMNGNS